MLIYGVCNVFIRGLTLISKFVLLFYIAKNFSADEVGVYGLVVVSINSAIYILGLDFYIFNSREILRSTKKVEQAYKIHDQLILHLASYICFLPAISVLFFMNILPVQYIVWFYLILVLEHLAQEAGRLLVTLSCPLMSNIIQFLRSGLWVYFLIGLLTLVPSLRNLHILWGTWVVGNILSLVVFSLYIKREKINFCINRDVDWKWVILGIKQSSFYFLGTIALQVTQYIDRFLIKYYHGDAMVGAYTFYCNTANIIQVFVYTGIIVLIQPKLIQAYQNKQMGQYTKLLKKLGFGVLYGSSGISLIMAILIFPLLDIVEKKIYSEYVFVYWIILTSILVGTIGQIPHYDLYAKGRDKEIFLCTVFAMIISIILTLLFIPHYGIYGAAGCSIVTMITLSVSKTILCIRYNRMKD